MFLSSAWTPSPSNALAGDSTVIIIVNEYVQQTTINADSPVSNGYVTVDIGEGNQNQNGGGNSGDETVSKISRSDHNHIIVSNLRHHYVINSAGAIDDSHHGVFMPASARGVEYFNRCSIEVKYNNQRLRALLFALHLDFRDKYTEAQILTKS